MSRISSFRWSAFLVSVLFAGVLAWPVAGTAQTLAGNATVVQATVLGTTMALANTGSLTSPSDPLDASLDTVSLPVVSGETLHAVTLGWTDQVASEASLANLGLTVGASSISADLVMAKALSLLGGASSGSSFIYNLSINGVSIAVTGEPNQTILIPGGQVVINEQTFSPAGITVNALHAQASSLFGGLIDVVVASAQAGIQ
jgi:hypothetical protein